MTEQVKKAINYLSKDGYTELQSAIFYKNIRDIVFKQDEYSYYRFQSINSIHYNFDDEDACLVYKMK